MWFSLILAILSPITNIIISVRNKGSETYKKAKIMMILMTENITVLSTSC